MIEAMGDTTSLADRKKRAGQRLLIGLNGYAVSDDLRKIVNEIRPAGFVLFKRNVADPAQVLELNRELASLVDAHDPALLAVDQEGGRVQRVRATEWPPMRVVGQARDRTGAVSRGLARELRAMGFNLNFAPVADVDSNPDNPIIGDRSFGRDPAEVSEHVVAFVRAHQAEHVIACAKHFPGHGDTSTDSHLDLPTVDRPEAELRRTELPPFKAAVEAGVGTVMSSHVVFPAWDPDHPATLSEKVIPSLLRKELGFDGVLFSDDMEMGAVAGRWSVEEQVWRATRASIDVLLVCEDGQLQVEMFRELVRAQERDAGVEGASKDAVRRMTALRQRFFLGVPPRPSLEEVGGEAHQGLALDVRARSTWS